MKTVVPGTISIFRIGRDKAQVVVKDSQAGAVIVDFQMSMVDFGRAVTGEGDLPGEATCYVKELVDCIGKTREIKKVIIPNLGVPTGKLRLYIAPPDAIGKAVSQHEMDTDGKGEWEYDHDSATNPHNYIEGKGQEVIFRRWV